MMKYETTVRAIADKYGIEQAALLAVIEVESAGQPFEPNGRPRFLFEKHVFYREIIARNPSKLTEAIKSNLARSKWVQDYSDQSTSAERAELFKRACEIDADCAFRACSWGIGQIMGHHAESLGYTSATHMVSAFHNIENQIEAIVKFCQQKNLLRHIEAQNWASFARGYNGSGYAKNRYDAKLLAAYNKWVKKMPKRKVQTQVAAPVATEYVSRPSDAPHVDERFRAVQVALRKLGYPVGNVDGRHGRASADAVESFQARHSLKGDRGCWYASYDAVLASAPSIVSEDRANTTVRDMVKRDPVARRVSWWQQLIMWLGVGNIAAGTLPETASSVSSFLTPLQGLFTLIGNNKPLFIGAMFIALALLLRWVINYLTTSYRDFTYQGTANVDGNSDGTNV